MEGSTNWLPTWLKKGGQITSLDLQVHATYRYLDEKSVARQMKLLNKKWTLKKQIYFVMQYRTCFWRDKSWKHISML